MNNTNYQSAASLVNETNPLPQGYVHEAREQNVEWTTPGLKITRLRLVSDPGFPVWDVSYCHGELNGESVNVILPFYQLPKRNFKAALYEHAKSTGHYINGLFSSISTLC